MKTIISKSRLLLLALLMEIAVLILLFSTKSQALDFYLTLLKK
jgi:hypothetical protein